MVKASFCQIKSLIDIMPKGQRANNCSGLKLPPLPNQVKSIDKMPKRIEQVIANQISNNCSEGKILFRLDQLIAVMSKVKLLAKRAFQKQ